MLREMLRKALMTGGSAALVLTVSAGMANAAATLKTLSTNYTLVNLSSTQANVSVSYYLENGSNWVADSGNTNFQIGPNGGQMIVRQYFDTTLTSGRGSAVVASDQPLGAVVQIQARNQIATTGAYRASSSTNTTYNVPLVAKNRSTSSGLANSQIMVQNAGTSTITVDFNMTKSAGSPGSNFTKTGVSIAPGATYYYDLTEETSASAPDGWIGSAVVTGSGQISVISNFFLGAHQLQTFSGFAPTDLTNEWYIPLFASNLPNRLNTPVTIQNLSGATINASGVSMVCSPTVGSGFSQATFTLTNPASIAVNESYSFNPVTDTTITPNWIGSCVLTAPGNVAAFIQMRFTGTGGNDNAAAFEAIKGSGTDRKVIVPLVAKLLSNGFATPVIIQNLGDSLTNVTFTYTPNSTCQGCQSYTETLPIAANASLQKNFRLAGTGPLPSGWEGSLTVVSDSQPIDGYVQLTFAYGTSGDNYMAHLVFTQPVP